MTQLKKGIWYSVKKDGYPPAQNHKKERRRYIVYTPEFTGHCFRCWYKGGDLFGCDVVQSMISNVTHYRIAGNQEYDCHLTENEIKRLK